MTKTIAHASFEVDIKERPSAFSCQSCFTLTSACFLAVIHFFRFQSHLFNFLSDQEPSRAMALSGGIPIRSLLVSMLLVLAVQLLPTHQAPLPQHFKTLSRDHVIEWSDAPYLARIHLNSSHTCTGVMVAQDVVVTVYEDCLEGR